MDCYTMTEEAYKRGYEEGTWDAVDKLMDFIPDQAKLCDAASPPDVECYGACRDCVAKWIQRSVKGEGYG